MPLEEVVISRRDNPTLLRFMSKGHVNRIKNRLLSALPPEEYKRLVPNLEFVSLNSKLIIYAPNQPTVSCLQSSALGRRAMLPLVAAMPRPSTV